MKNKRILLLIVVLAALTTVVASIYLNTRDSVPEGTFVIETSAKTESLSLAEQELTGVRGTIVNGKGEEKSVDAQGILLSELLARLDISGFEEVMVEADDSYSATVSAEEVAAPEKVYLITQEDGGTQLIVFGDPNSKRMVTDVVRLQIR